MAFIGGLISITASVYFFLLGVCLIGAAISLLLRRAPDESESFPQSSRLASIIGGGLGFVSGMVGIGGGIFLAPVLHHLRWASAKTIAALCSFFILINSLSGLAGQALKMGTDAVLMGISVGAPLLMEVTIGGVVGGRFVIAGVAHQRVAQLTVLLSCPVALTIGDSDHAILNWF